jgi:hypothetical protein
MPVATEIKRNDDGGMTVVMVACPFCGQEFGDGGERVPHIMDCEEAPIND